MLSIKCINTRDVNLSWTRRVGPTEYKFKWVGLKNPNPLKGWILTQHEQTTQLPTHFQYIIHPQIKVLQN